MHPGAMLTEIVMTRPDFVFLGAICSYASKAPIGSVFWCYLVHTFLVPFQIIVGAEATSFPRTIWFLASIRPCMTEKMFSEKFSAKVVF